MVYWFIPFSRLFFMTENQLPFHNQIEPNRLSTGLQRRDGKMTVHHEGFFYASIYA